MYSYNFDNNYLLLNYTTFVYIFDDKNRFTNFRKVIKGQKLLYNIKTITIKN